MQSDSVLGPTGFNIEPPAKMVVAVVDDDVVDFQNVKRLLDRSDFESPVVVHLDKLEAAQAWLSKNTPDVVLVDYLLDGGRDGMELIASLATGGDRAPAIMLTGARDAVVEIAAMQSGVFDYLNKGLLDVTSLERAIRFAIQRFRVERRLRESEGRLAAAAHLAEEAHAERTRVMAQLGHEFRTPLNAIIGFSDLLRDDVLTPNLPDRARAYASDIFASGQTLLGLLDAIFEAEAAAAARREPSDEVMRLSEQIAAAHRQVDHRLTRRGAELVVAPDLDRVLLRGDRRMVGQVLFSILSNASQFVREGGKVEVASHVTDQGIVLAITDDGPGMTVLEIQHALGPSPEWLGSNPGASPSSSLSIASRLMELHGGLLAITSAPGEGCSVELRFPLHRMETAASH